MLPESTHDVMCSTHFVLVLLVGIRKNYQYNRGNVTIIVDLFDQRFGPFITLVQGTIAVENKMEEMVRIHARHNDLSVDFRDA